MSGLLPIGDTTVRTIEHALNGLAVRSEVIANNVANSEVPGFHSSRVSFEQTLRSALKSGDLSRAKPAEVTADPSLAGPNGNNVSLETEFTELMKTNLLQEAMVNAFNFKAAVFRTAVRGG